MTARDEASKATWDTITNLSTGEVAQLVDAIPGDVLVRLAIERGALKEADTWDIADWVPLYQVVES